MYCRKCGAQNDDNAYKCVQCGEVLREQPPAETINNYLVPSILVTVFCCLFTGIPAIVFSAQVNGKVQARDYEGARQSSANALKWIYISLVMGLIQIVLQVIYMVYFSANFPSLYQSLFQNLK